ASDTRLAILRALDERNMTVSELGRRLDLNKATVFEHCEKLVASGLVKKLDDEDRKWVYYALSWKGRRLLHPERVTIALLFSAAFGALLGGFVTLAEYARLAGEATQAGPAQATPRIAAAPIEAAPAPVADPTLLYLGLALLVLVAALGLAALWLRQRMRAAEAQP
ncbi:MAG: winged helix-turn-helix domain-containing protein, partial [Halobacteriales archaeon]|nr:winged helix-turn-helix domain-containing protein [Halobacteriales archaeon]